MHITAPASPEFESDAARETYFRKVLGTARHWAYLGLLEVYANQTATEQGARSTFDRNGVGFNSADAEICSSFADQLTNKIATYGEDDIYMSSRQDAVLFRIMPKYAGQVIASLEARGVLAPALPFRRGPVGVVLDADAARKHLKPNAAMAMVMKGKATAQQSGEFHCGLLADDGKATFEWEVECVANLDQKGFVIDNQEIRVWFESIEEISVSCETFCQIAAGVIWKMMARPVGIRVKIWGLPDVAYAEFIDGKVDGKGKAKPKAKAKA